MVSHRFLAGGIVLCGGESKRMGRPKAWLPFGGETMLGRVIRLLAEEAHPVVVVAAPGQDVPPLPAGVSLIRDEVKGRGPLQGLLAGLKALSNQVEAAYLSSCDVPFLCPAFIRRMLDLLGNRAICVPYVDGYHHPMAAVYRMDVIDAVSRLISENRMRPVFLFESVSTRIVEARELIDVDPAMISLRNLNTPEEYQKALAELGGCEDD
jgi:molybdopterin-guanine dinucleotide biosynthesis protein A